MPASKDHYLGCVFGLALGDALGAPYEGGVVERLLWKLIGRTPEGLPRWTDDTQMTLDIAHSLLAVGILDQNELARRFADSYHWSRGYGPSTARLLKRIRRGEPWQQASTAIYPSGSFGNGAAMRASILALYFHDDLWTLTQETRRSAEITHAHPLAIEGALLMAISTHLLLNRASIEAIITHLQPCCSSPEFHSRLQIAQDWLSSERRTKPKEVASRLGNGMTAHTSVITAIYVALYHLRAPFAEMLKFVRDCKGDVDTIGAMAGTLWGACNGASTLLAIPVEQHDELERVALQLFNRCSA